MNNLVSLSGVFFILFIAWVFSKDRASVNWRLIIWGVGLQFLFALFVFYIPAGLFLFEHINNIVVKALSFANSGMYFVFGPLAVSPGTIGPNGEKSLGFILAFQALPAVIFFSSLMAILYHTGIMQKVIRVFSIIFTRLMKISGAEALCASSNILVGIESALTIRPYIEEMTMSELCTVLTAGMATIASTVMAVYVSFLSKDFPTIAGHLVSASILSTPAAIVISKLIYPEDRLPRTGGQIVSGHYEKASTWIESVIRGANEGVKLVVGIIALLLSFLGLLAMCNWVLSASGRWLGNMVGITVNLSLEKILAFIFYPLVILMGVPLNEALQVATLLGERVIVTELVSYQHLAQFISSGDIASARSIVISSYALCGFSHIASLAIFVGGISALAPQRAKDLARLGLRSLCAANLACLMTGAVAGVFFTFNGQILRF